MTNENKDKIIDRVIDFLHNKPLKSDMRIAAALIEELKLVKNCSIPDVGQSLPDAEQCLKIQEQVKQYCYTDQDDKPVISSGGIRAIISRWKQMVG